MPNQNSSRLMAVVIAAAAFALPAAAGAQQAGIGAVQPQARVRFTAPAVVSARQAITGTVMQVNDTALVVRWDQAPQDDPLVVPFRAMTSLDVSEGRVSGGDGRGRGAKTGAMLGLGVGLLLGAGSSLHNPPLRFVDPGAHVAKGLAVGGLLGTGIGALLGGHGYER